MLKALFRKQMLEIWKFVYLNTKTGKRRTGASLLLYSIFMLAIFAILGGIFFTVGSMLCEPLAEAGMGWLYFALMGLIGVALGVFGSVFNTYAGLYQAKDNGLLLSMPIPPSAILAVRMSGVYLMGLLYEAVVMIPAVIVYYMTVKQTLLSVVFSVFLIFVLSFFVLTLSCLLGWVVALISGKLKNKSIVTVIVSVAFLAVYFYFYSTAYQSLQRILQNSHEIGETFKRTLSPLYHMGMAAQGNVFSMLVFTFLVLALAALCYYILSRSFLKIATKSSGGTRAKYQKKALKVYGADGALLRKELKRFTSSPIYMLNCALGTVLMPIASAAILIKAGWLRTLIAGFGPLTEKIVPLIACAAVCMMATMNDITAPSVSLEGKNLWIVQSFPVPAKMALQAKIKLHLWLTLIPALICVICLEIVFRPDLLSAVIMPLCVIAFVVLSATSGLCLNLKMPNLNWTSETVPVKQSIGVMLSMFGGWAAVIVLGVLYYVVNKFVAPNVFLLCCTALLSLISAVLFSWINRHGAEIFTSL